MTDVKKEKRGSVGTFLVIAAIVIGLAAVAIPRFSQIAELQDQWNRVLIYPDSITVIVGVDVDGDSTELVRVPVHYNLADSATAAAKIRPALVNFVCQDPTRALVHDGYEYRDEYFENDSTTIVVAEYYALGPIPVGYE